MVEKMMPPDATLSRLHRSARLDACRGDSGKSWVQAAKVPNSWSSRSFLSVSTTTVGFWKQCMILAV